jgi:YVTN family beta-propeller protein
MTQMMRNVCLSVFLVTLGVLSAATASSASKASDGFKVVKKFPLEGGGRWDYLVVGNDSRRLFMSRATHVAVLDADSGAVVGDIPDTPGVHGIALAPDLGVGFISDGGENKVAVFDLKTLQVLTKIETGKNPDSIVFYPPTKMVFVQNGGSNSSTVIDATTRQVVATIPLAGRPEFTVYDDDGNLYINLEDKSSLSVIDGANKSVKSTWPLSPCEGPTGLAIDRKSHMLFSACDNKIVAVTDAHSGKVVQTVPIGDDCDAVAFDPATGYLFASNGGGQLSIIKKNASGKYALVKNLTSAVGSKTMALDEAKHQVFLPSAKFTGDPTAHPRPSVVPGSVAVLVVGR